MARELPGFALPEGFRRLPVEFLEDSAAPIVVTSFDFSALDSPEDLAREALAIDSAGHMGIVAFFEQLAEGLLRAGTADQLARWLPRLRAFFWAEGYKDALADQITSDDPKFDAWLLSEAFGLSHAAHLTVPQICARWGKRKQAGYQRQARLLHARGLRHLRPNARNAAARQKMRERNFRHLPKTVRATGGTSKSNEVMTPPKAAP